MSQLASRGQGATNHRHVDPCTRLWLQAAAGPPPWLQPQPRSPPSCSSSQPEPPRGCHSPGTARVRDSLFVLSLYLDNQRQSKHCLQAEACQIRLAVFISRCSQLPEVTRHIGGCHIVPKKLISLVTLRSSTNKFRHGFATVRTYITRHVFLTSIPHFCILGRPLCRLLQYRRLASSL